jgi:hypothetical protein
VVVDDDGTPAAPPQGDTGSDGGVDSNGGAGAADARSERRFEDLGGIAQHDVTEAVMRGRRVEDVGLRPFARDLATRQARGYGIVAAVAGGPTVAAIAVMVLLSDRAPIWLGITAVVVGPMVSLYAFALYRSARRAAVANATDDAAVPLRVADRLAAVPPAAFVGLLSTWLLRALIGAVVVGLDVTVHPAVLGVPLGLISLGVAVATYQRILADWRS